MRARRLAAGAAAVAVAAGGAAGVLLSRGGGGRALVSYNQGLAVADYTFLWRDTHDARYLRRAEQLAAASGRAFGTFGWDPRAAAQQPGFAAAYFRGLSVLQSVAPSVAWTRQRAGFAAFVRAHPVRGRATVDRATGLWRDPAYPAYRWAFLWQQSQAVAAQLDRGDGRAIRALRWYFEPRQRALGSALRNAARPTPYGDLYYDDNAWAALDYLKAFAVTGRRAYLHRAGVVFGFLRGGWDRRFGGERWARVGWNHDLSTVATAASAEVALRLYARTRRRGYLVWAVRAMGWLEARMRSPSGLFYDRLTVVTVGRGRRAHPAVVVPSGGAYGPHAAVPADPVLYLSAVGVADGAS